MEFGYVDGGIGAEEGRVDGGEDGGLCAVGLGVGVAAVRSPRKGSCMGACWAARVAVVRSVAARRRAWMEVNMSDNDSDLNVD